jgi:predicted translin family RNA/ssDNA-binding protein
MTDHSLAIILQKLSSLENTVQEIKGEVKDVKGKVEKLDEKVEKLDEKVEKLRTENGHIFEMIARNEIAKKHGQHYSECFVVFDINGLVRLSTPKEKLSSEELEYENQASILEHRTNKIANHIFVSDDS